MKASIIFGWCVIIAILSLSILVVAQERRIEALEEIYNRPIANCIEMSDLLRNRPYPPKHGVHSHAKEVRICDAR